MSEDYRKEIVQHIVKNLLEIQLLRIVQFSPTWGYQIKKRFETDFDVKLRHGDLYSSLNALKARGFLECKTIRESGRPRKVYAITETGQTYLQTYNKVLRAQIKDHKPVKQSKL
jgi:DNA-binding PadR family transcriptional regulator